MKHTVMKRLIGAAAWFVSCAAASPVHEAWPVPTTVGVSASAAGLAGFVATGENGSKTVEVRDGTGAVIRSVSLASIATSVGGIDAAAAGLGSLAFSESGRLLFITVQSPAAGAGVTSRVDEVIRLEVDTGAVSRFATLAVSGTNAALASGAMCHWTGKLFVGGNGGVMVYTAGRNNTTGTVSTTYTLTPGVRVSGLSIDRTTGDLYATQSNGALWRVRVSTGALSNVGNFGTPIAGVAFSEQYGGAGQDGLYAATEDRRLLYVSPSVARGTGAFAFTTYSTMTGVPGGVPSAVATTCDGRLIVSTATGAATVRDTADTRLTFTQWKSDEFQQVVTFCKGLISPDGEPAGWVIDADVWPAWTRFHPATPDGAAWVVLTLIMNEELTGDPQALPLCRSILTRYAGLSPDNIRPSRNADGIFEHWIDPLTGNRKAQWGDGPSTLSTMKIVAAASRALKRWPSDPQIIAAAQSIVCGVHNLDGYVNSSTKRIAFNGLPGGGGTGTWTTTHNETLIFAEQAAWNGGPASRIVYPYWLARDNAPFGTYILNRWVRSDGFYFLPIFTTAYANLLMKDFRDSAAWRENMGNHRASASAWTDDNGPRWYTVFSAGTTKDIWGGYHADAINNNAGNIAHFPGILTLAATPGVTTGNADAAAAYHAYRTGARETFRNGASILYRRSSIDPAYTPNSAGLPDVCFGALGLAELLSPGAVDRVLTGRYPACSCVADIGVQGGLAGRDAQRDNNDFVVFIDAFFGQEFILADVGVQGGGPGRDGVLDNNDFVSFINAFFGACP